MTDLSEIKLAEKSNEGAVMNLLHPITNEPILDDKGEPQWIRAAGQYSAAFQKTQREALDRRINARKGFRPSKISADQLDREGAEALARCVIEWNILADGKQLECDFATVQKFLLDPRFKWVRDQLDEFVADESSFK